MSAVFLCFLEADRGVAERLARALESAGVEIWREDGTLVAAESAAANPSFDPKPATMAALLAIWTPGARQSPWVRDLTRSALGFAKLINVSAGLAAVPFPYNGAPSHALEPWLGGGDLTPLVLDLRGRLAEADGVAQPSLAESPQQPAPAPEAAHTSALEAEAAPLAPDDAPLAAAKAETAPMGFSAPEPADAAAAAAPQPEAAPAPPAPIEPAASPATTRTAPPSHAPAATPPHPARRSRGPDARALWAGGALAVVAAVAVGGFLVLGRQHAVAPKPAVAAGGPAIDSGTAPASDLASANRLAQATVGRWSISAQGCDHPADISVSQGQLTLRRSDGTSQTGVIQADTADTFAVQTSDAAVTYTIAGKVLTISGGANGPITFNRCPNADGRAAPP